MNRPERAAAYRAGRDASAGFTLIELVVVLTLSAVIGGSVVALLHRQSRFYRISGDAVFAGQSVRATVDLFVRELRGASSSDLLAAASDSLVIRADLHRGVVCRVADQTVTYFVYASPPANVSGPPGTVVAGPGGSGPAYDPDFDAYGSTASALEREACRDAGAPRDGGYRAFRTVDWSTSALPPPERGAWLRLVAPLTYRVGPSSFAEGLAVWRERQELAAPFRTAAFRYGLADGTEVARVSSPELASVGRVRIELVATGPSSSSGGADRRISFDVFLRS